MPFAADIALLFGVLGSAIGLMPLFWTTPLLLIGARCRIRADRTARA